MPGVVRSLQKDDDLPLVAMGSETNLELVLSGSTRLATSASHRTAGRVALWVDEPREVAASLRALVRQP